MGLYQINECYHCIRISIHPPREGWDLTRGRMPTNWPPFQSTHPVRGGTVHEELQLPDFDISIHPPREGWDNLCPLYAEGWHNFNPPTP